MTEITPERRYGSVLTIELLGWAIGALLCVVLMQIHTPGWLLGSLLFAFGGVQCAYHLTMLAAGHNSVV